MSNPRSRRGTRLAAGAAILGLMVSLLVGLVGSVAPANAAIGSACTGANADPGAFPDAGLAANCLKGYSIANGKLDGTFGENDNLIRAQFASFATRFLTAANIAHAARQSFPDVDSNSTPDANVLREIEEGHAAGVVNGFTNGNFGPNTNMSVAQGATIVMNLCHAIHVAKPSAPDCTVVNDPATGKPDTSATYDAAVAQGILDLNAADKGGTKYPNAKSDTTKRGLFADMLGQLLQKEVDAGVIPKHTFSSTNQTFTPDSASTGNPSVTTFVPQSAGGTGTRTKNVTFTGVGTDPVDVATLPCSGDYGVEGYVFNTNGLITFRDSDNTGPLFNPDSKADALGENGFDNTTAGGGVDGAIDIQSINGSPAPDQQYNNDITPDGGEVLVSLLNDTDSGDCVQVVVFRDANSDNALNLATSNAPTEAFGVTGPLVWTSGEAANGASGADVVFYDRANNILYTDDTDGVFYRIKANDVPTYDDQFPLTLSEFKQDIGAGDEFDFSSNDYSRTAPNSFDIFVDFTQMPTNVSAVQGDFDSGAGANDIKLSWTSPTDGEIDHFCAFRSGTSVSDPPGNGGCTPDGSGPTVNSIVDSDPTPGSYSYRVFSCTKAGTGCGDENEDDSQTYLSEPITGTVTGPAPAPVAGPPVSNSAVFQDNNNNGFLDNTDILTITFNEPMDAPAAGDRFTVTDQGDGTTGTIINGTNATFAVSSTNTVLTVTMTQGPIIGGTGTTVSYPADVTSTTGNTDADEHFEWDLGNSGDTTF
ncbi:MAG: hypothetical protein QOC92_2611 [Acidimicrobiaceae bacterium]|jgi:hypothetical protein